MIQLIIRTRPNASAMLIHDNAHNLAATLWLSHVPEVPRS